VFLLYKCGYDVVMETTTAITATRTIKNNKAVVTITFPDGTTAKASGARAERAEGAVAFKNYHGKWQVGLRASLTVAQNEAMRANAPHTVTLRKGFARPHVIECEGTPDYYACPITTTHNNEQAGA